MAKNKRAQAQANDEDKKTTREDIIATLWKAADTFRDKIDAANYKDYILSMLFVKYLSDYFNERVDELKKQYPNEILLKRHIGNLPYVLKEESTFGYLHANKEQNDIGRKITEALNGIETSNSVFGGIFRSIDFNSEAFLGRKEQRNAMLKNLLIDFSSLNLRPSNIEVKAGEVPADIIGDAYEDMIGKFATMAGKKAGSFYTPQAVSEILAQVVSVQENETVYDPTCGSGSLLIRAANYAKGKQRVSVYGQEVNGSAISMAKMNMFLHDIKDADIRWGDTIASPQHLDSNGNLKRFDCIVANMPFSLDKWAQGFNIGEDAKPTATMDRWRRFDIGVPPASKGDWAFLLHMIASVSGSGRIAAIAPHGVLFRGSSEGIIRKSLIERNLLDAVIGLPENLFYGTSIPACILVFRKGRTTKDILFIDASKEFKKVKAKNELTPEHIKKVVSVYKAFKNGEEQKAEIEKYSCIASIAEIEENEYNLNIPRYVDTFEEEAPIDIKKVNTEIAELKSKIADVEKQMAFYLKELGVSDDK